jgi:hypothetical protein
VRRWLQILLACVFVGFVIDRAFLLGRAIVERRHERHGSLPGESEFRAANQRIIRSENEQVAFGNSPAGEELAQSFSTAMAEARKEGFTEGNNSAFSLSKHRFLTYCRLDADSCVFLVHVPELRRFTGDAQQSLGDLAWVIAHKLAYDAGLPPGSRLAVGVKGTINYEAVLIGELSNREHPLTDITQNERGVGLEKNRLFYPFFAGTAGSDAPPALAALPTISPPSPNRATHYADYLGLLGEDFQGNVFVIQAHARRWAVMSRHQFETEAAPTRAEDPDTEKAVALHAPSLVLQDDVQLISLSDQTQSVPYLGFNPAFELAAGEKLWIQRGDGRRGTTGILLDQGLKRGVYNPIDGPASLAIRLDTPTDVRGASGIPIIQVKTGLPIGVLLAADDGKAAQTVIFEPISAIGRLTGPPEEAALSALLPGTWTENYARSGIDATAVLRFDPDGGYSSTMPAPVGKPVVHTGRWKVEAGKLVYYDLRSNHATPSMVADHIIEAGENYLIYRGENQALALLRKDPMASPPSSQAENHGR